MASKKKTIFLVEDDLTIIDVYKTAFKLAGIDFEVMALGRQVIDRIKDIQCDKAEKPSLVLLDLILPDMNGTEILKEIKGNEKTKDITVFLLSNYTNDESLQTDGIKPDKFILKAGITPTQLIKLIEIQLKKS